MSTIYDLKKRAKELSEKNEVNSVSPVEVGNLIDDTLSIIDEYNKNAVGLGIRKTYPDIASMQADSTNPVGNDDKPIRFGQLASVYDKNNPESKENGGVYAFQNPGWKLVTTTAVNVVSEFGNSETNAISQKFFTEKVKDIVVANSNSTVRFDRIENSLLYIEGITDSAGGEVVFASQNKKFCYVLNGRAYERWSGYGNYFDTDNKVYRDKIYLCGNKAYLYFEGDLHQFDESDIKSVSYDDIDTVMTGGIYQVYDSDSITNDIMFVTYSSEHGLTKQTYINTNPNIPIPEMAFRAHDGEKWSEWKEIGSGKQFKDLGIVDETFSDGFADIITTGYYTYQKGYNEGEAVKGILIVSNVSYPGSTSLNQVKIELGRTYIRSFDIDERVWTKWEEIYITYRDLLEITGTRETSTKDDSSIWGELKGVNAQVSETAVGMRKFSTARFDAIVTDSAIFISGITNEPGGEVVYVTNKKKFAYLLNERYYNEWTGSVNFMKSNAVIPDKIYLLKEKAYIFYDGDLHIASGISTYQDAQSRGYKGSEEDFYNRLSNIDMFRYFKSITYAEIDSITSSGYYIVTDDYTYSSDILLVSRYGEDDAVAQVFFSCQFTGGMLKKRIQTGGKWSEWEEIGSGLRDAMKSVAIDRLDELNDPATLTSHYTVLYRGYPVGTLGCFTNSKSNIVTQILEANWDIDVTGKLLPDYEAVGMKSFTRVYNISSDKLEDEIPAGTWGKWKLNQKVIAPQGSIVIE